MLMTVVGSALGAWWLVTQQRSRMGRSSPIFRGRGTVIFDNSPRAADDDAGV
jgi:hypothetical protein